MPVRKGSAEWRGDLKKGSGDISTESGVLNRVPYSFASRFEQGRETNPEELIGAAHAACYSMALSNMLSGAGFTVRSVKAEDKVHIEKVESGFSITRIEIRCDAEIPGIDEAVFRDFAEKAKRECPVSKALAGTELTLSASLRK
jgi:osmotically inducible protein OsmC